jgi:hypothetical protein
MTTQTEQTTEGPTPRTDAVAKEIGSLAMRWRSSEIYASDFAAAAQAAINDLGQLERENAELRAALEAAGHFCPYCQTPWINHHADCGADRARVALERIEKKLACGQDYGCLEIARAALKRAKGGT